MNRKEKRMKHTHLSQLCLVTCLLHLGSYRAPSLCHGLQPDTDVDVVAIVIVVVLPISGWG